MIYRTFYVDHQPNDVVRFWIPGIPDYRIGFLIPINIYTGKLWLDRKHSTSIFETDTYYTLPLRIPVFAEKSKDVKTEIYTGNDSNPISFVVAYFKDDEVEGKVDLDAKTRYKYFDITLDAGGQFLETILFRNDTNHDIYVRQIDSLCYGTRRRKHSFYRNTELIARRVNFNQEDVFWNTKIETVLHPGDYISVSYDDAGGNPGDHDLYNIVISNSIGIDIDWLYYSNQSREKYYLLPEIPGEHILSKASSIPDIIPIKENILAYPVNPQYKRYILAPIPYPIDINTSNLYGTEAGAGPVSLVRPDEQAVVERLPGPYGAVRKSSDPSGRMRVSGAGIRYRSGKAVASDATAQILYTGWGTKKVEIYAKTLDWEIQILPVYDWLSGKSITDMDTIYVDQGQSISIDIEARIIQATCPSATATTNGELYWEVME